MPVDNLFDEECIAKDRVWDLKVYTRISYKNRADSDPSFGTWGMFPFENPPFLYSLAAPPIPP